MIYSIIQPPPYAPSRRGTELAVLDRCDDESVGAPAIMVVLVEAGLAHRIGLKAAQRFDGVAHLLTRDRAVDRLHRGRDRHQTIAADDLAPALRLGAVILLNTPARTFLNLVPWLLLISATIFAASGPVTRWLERRKGKVQGTKPDPPRLPLFLLTAIVCFYIGYFGAGAGFLLITLLSVFGIEDMNEINALKVVSTTMANGVAFVIFVVGRQVEWRYCLLAMVAAAIGGYSSASFARFVPRKVLRTSVIVIGFGMAAWFFYKNSGR